MPKRPYARQADLLPSKDALGHEYEDAPDRRIRGFVAQSQIFARPGRGFATLALSRVEKGKSCSSLLPFLWRGASPPDERFTRVDINGSIGD